MHKNNKNDEEIIRITKSKKKSKEAEIKIKELDDETFKKLIKLIKEAHACNKLLK